MKHLLKVLTFAVICMFTSCSGSQPKDIAQQVAGCLQDKDYNGLVELMAPEGEMKESQKALLISLMEEKNGKSIERKGGIKSYEIGEQEIDEEKNVARVKVTYTFGNGTQETQNLKFKKKEDKWYLSM